MLGARRETPEDLAERDLARADPYVLAAQHEGESWETLWRMAYALPPNDPRYLDMPEEDMYHDLLVRLFHHEHMHRMTSPGEAAQEAIQASRAAQEELEALRKRVVAHVQAGIQSRKAKQDAKAASTPKRKPKPKVRP